MKTKYLWKWSLGLSLAVLLFLGCGQKSGNLVVQAATLDQEAVISGDSTNPPPPAQFEQDLENAPAQVVSTPKPPANTLSTPASEIVKLAQAGVDESVMMAYVTNSTYVFNLNSDDIIYLNDVGVPGSVVTAMLQRDQAVRADVANGLSSAPPVYTNPPAGGAPTPYDNYQEPQSTEVVENIPAEPQVNVTYSYFYDSLSPYGTWINVEGYGRCWQPTVVVVNRSWQPYCNSGRWVYSDCGWYWASDYSWGWAPFHYGRWFQHGIWGWCWAPDTVWAPSWVTWRYTSGYCGWAPLPPSACYKPGVGFTYYGRSVGANFNYGLNARHYAFVPVNNFYNRHPSRYLVPQNTVNRIYPTTVATHNFSRDTQNRIINHGIPVDEVRSATRTDIHPVQITTADRPVQNRITRITRDDHSTDRSLAVYAPKLPQPEGTPRVVGEGVRPAPRQNFDRVNYASTSGNQKPVSVTRQSDNTSADSRKGGRDSSRSPNVENSVTASPSVPNRPNDNVVTGNSVRGNGGKARKPNEPMILRGPDRSAYNAQNNGVQNANPQRTRNSTRDEANAARETVQRTAPTWQPKPAVRANPSPTVPVQQYNPSRRSETPPTMTPPQQSQRLLPQNTPVYRAPSVPNIAPSAPVQRQQPIPSYQAPRIETPRYTPPVRTEMPSMPSVQTRQAPQMQSPPVQSPSQSQSGSSRSSGGNGRNR